MAHIHLSESKLKFLVQGAILQDFVVAKQNIVLSLPDKEAYLSAPYFGETIGRVANRISGGYIDNLNGKEYHLATNDRGKNHHHGGNHGWGRRSFSGPETVKHHGRDALLFTYLSPDGEEGYPGSVELRVWYTGYEELEDGVLRTILEIEYEASLVDEQCQETIINVTNHSYFNIGDEPTIEGTQIVLATSSHLPVDADGIPTGEVAEYPGIEAGQPFILGRSEPQLDYCFVVNTDPDHQPLDTRNLELRRLASAYHPSTSITLEVYSTEPAFQLYTGDANNVPASTSTRAYGPRSGFCVEPARFINAVNVPEWRQQVLLSKNQKYGSRIVYKAWKA